MPSRPRCFTAWSTARYYYKVYDSAERFAKVVFMDRKTVSRPIVIGGERETSRVVLSSQFLTRGNNNNICFRRTRRDFPVTRVNTIIAKIVFRPRTMFKAITHCDPLGTAECINRLYHRSDGNKI